MSTVMPTSWTIFSIADLGGVSGGKTPSKDNPHFWSSRDVPWVSPKDMKKNVLHDAADRISQLAINQAGMTLYPANSVLMVTRSGILQHTFPVALAAVQLTVNQDIKVFRPTEGLDPKYFFYVIRSFGGDILSACSKDGTTVQSIDSEKLEAFPLPLPPVAEQTRIAAKLDELLAQVDTLKARIDSIPALLKRFRQSVLTAATSGRLTSEQGSSGYDEWIRGKLGDYVAIDIGHAFKSSDFSVDGTRLLRGQNIEPGSLRWIETKFFPEEKLSSFKHLLISEGDIILAMDRPIVSAGLKLAKAKREDLPCLLVQRVCRFKQSQKITNDYLMLLLSDYAFSNYLIPNQTGSDIPHISGKQILNYPVTLPTLDEQTEIVRRVEKLFAFANQLEVRVKAAQARIYHLTQSILTIAFRGDLVPQDPNDEPASVLLDRIKAQRSAAPKAKRGRRSVTAS